MLPGVLYSYYYKNSSGLPETNNDSLFHFLSLGNSSSRQIYFGFESHPKGRGLKISSRYPKIPLLAGIALVVSALSACSILENPVIQTLHQAFVRDNNATTPALNPHFQYLRITVGARIVFLALGNIDPNPEGNEQVWYSASGEVVRLRNGRVVEATGLFTEWRHVTLPKLPSWSFLAQEKTPYRWTRIRDVMPGYRYGVEDTLVLRVIPPPRKSALLNLDPSKLVWFEEKDISTESPLLPAKYAVDMSDGEGIVVYGELCLARDLCFSWQRWPATVGGKESR